MKIMQELTKERPYVQFLTEKAVQVMDDVFVHTKISLSGPEPADFRKQLQSE
jgi:hypothetical protein